MKNRRNVKLEFNHLEKLTAISYMMGYKGLITKVANKLLADGINMYVDGLAGKKKTEYEAVLENTKIMFMMAPEKKIKKPPYTYVKKKQRGGI